MTVSNGKLVQKCKQLTWAISGSCMHNLFKPALKQNEESNLANHSPEFEKMY